MADEFRVLSDKEHALIATDMFIGSVSMETHDVLVDGKFIPLTYVPGLVKIIDEVIDNSVDEAIRTDFEFATLIEVEIRDNWVTVRDNGRGLPQQNVLTPDGTTIPLPLAAWTRARAGSNFNADRKGIGKNGIGSALTNFFSDSFIGETSDGEHKVTVRCTNNADDISYVETKSKTRGTIVKFLPDFEKFGVLGLGSEIEQIVKSRLSVLSVNFPKIVFRFNGDKIDGKFNKFVESFGETVSVSTDNFSLFFANDVEFRQLSFVNGVHTKHGGNHVNGVIDNLSDELIPLIKRTHKIEITKARIKECLLVGLFIRNLTAAKYDGQTKERLSSSWGQIKDHMDIDYKALAKKFIKAESIITPIIESALARRDATDKAMATKALKKAKGMNVAKHVKANGIGRLNTTLFLAEGDSAIGPFARFRDENTQGGFPLRGKILNVWDLKDHEVLQSKEITEILSILGVGLRDKTHPQYNNIAIMTDADTDGKGSIALLLIAFFYKYWPQWFDQGRIKIVRTPEFISKNGKKVVWSYDKDEFDSHKFGKGWEHRHIKGLGSLTTEGDDCEYKQCITDPVLETIAVDDESRGMLEMLFGSDESKRKEWLGFGDV